jgi:hypothetical protein
MNEMLSLSHSESQDGRVERTERKAIIVFSEVSNKLFELKESVKDAVQYSCCLGRNTSQKRYSLS